MTLTMYKRQVPGVRSSELLAQSQRYEPECAADQVPVVWDHADGVWVTDVDANTYLDFTSGVLVTNIGHSHPHAVEAIQRQVERLANCYSFPTPERVELAKRVVEMLPENLDRVFMLTTGAEATEAALRVAKRYTGKHEVLSFFGAFHGRTYGAMSVAGMGTTRRGFGPTIPGNVLAPYPYCYRCPFGKTYPDCGLACIDFLDRAVEAGSGGDLGTVIVEPYEGTAGFVFPPDGWLKALEQWCAERDLILIVDEVQASFGRTGRSFAIDWEDVRPQLLCLGKGFGSALPASALAGEKRIFDAMAPGELSSTWGGNPVSSAAAGAVLDVIEAEHLVTNAEQVGTALLGALRALQERHRCIGDVRGKGLVIGVEIVDPDDGYTPAPEITGALTAKAAEWGLLLGKLGMYGNVVRVAPPLVITEDEALFGVQIIDQALTELNLPASDRR